MHQITGTLDRDPKALASGMTFTDVMVTDGPAKLIGKKLALVVFGNCPQAAEALQGRKKGDPITVEGNIGVNSKTSEVEMKVERVQGQQPETADRLRVTVADIADLDDDEIPTKF